MSDLLSFWYQALQADVGIKLSAVNVRLAKQKLYSARAQASDPQLKQISLVPSRTNPSHLFLIKKEHLQ